MRLLTDKLQEFVVALFREYQQAAVLHHSFVNGANAMPAPRLNTLAHGIVEDDGNICLVDFKFGAAFRFELLLGQIGGYEGEIFARNAVSLRSIAVTAVGKRGLPHSARNHDDVAADLLRQIFLKDASIVNFYAFDHIFPPRLKVYSIANQPRR